LGATSVTLKTFTDINGNLLTMSNFGSIGFGTLEPGNNTQEEQISFTGVTQNANGTATLTGVSHVAFLSPYTQTSGLSVTHAGNTPFIISNTSGFYNELTSKDDDATVNGNWTFTKAVTIPLTPVNPTDAASKGYADSLAIAGAPNASTSVQGLVQEATVAQVNAGTATGSTGAVLFASPADLASSNYGLDLPSAGQKAALAGSSGTPGAGNLYVTANDTSVTTGTHAYAADSGTANTYVVALSPVVGSLVAGQTVKFLAGNANTGASTLAVNAQAAKAITKNGAVALAAGDISANQLVSVIYDGTQFQLQTADTPNALTTTKVYFSPGSVSVNATTTDTNLVSTNLAGGILGTGNAIRFKFWITVLSSTGGANLALNLKYGGTSNTLFTFSSVANSTVKGWVEGYLFGSGATNSQGADMITQVINNSGTVTYFTTALGATYAKDSTTSQTLVISAQWSSATGTSFTASDFAIDIIK